MMNLEQPRRLAALSICLLGLMLNPAGASAQGAPAANKGAPAATAPPATESQQRARAILMLMAQYLGKAPRFSVTVRGAYDAVQASGEKIEFAENRRIVLSRPDNRMRIEGEHSDGSRVLTVFNGKEILLVDSGSNVYATAAQTGNLDETIVHFVRDLGVRLPLAALLLSRMGAEFDTRVQTIDYIEATRVHGQLAHHIAARTDSVDFQVWIADGSTPLPLRIVLTYREAPGQPQFRAQLSDWNMAPAISGTTFTAAPPKGAQKVAFVGQLAAQARTPQPASPDKGKAAK